MNRTSRETLLAVLFTAVTLAVGITVWAEETGRWSKMYLPEFGDVWNLEAVAFSSPARGWAVGAIEDKGCAVILKREGGDWKKVYSPCGGKLRVLHLVDIALSGPQSGWAVGDIYWVWSDPDRFKAFSARMQGGKWKAVGVPRAGLSVKLEGVAVEPGSKIAWAVGGVAQRKKRRGLVMRYTSKWREVNVPNPVGSQWELKDVSCPADGRCWAVGNLIDPPKGRNPLVILAYRHGEWQREQAPMPSVGIILPGLNCVSFPTPGRGWAAGKGLILSYRDGKWQQDIPVWQAINWNITSISFPETEYGYAVGWDLDSKKPLWLERTPEGWRRLKTQFDAKVTSLSGVFFLKRGLGWAVGGAKGDSIYPAGAYRYQSQ